MVNSDFEASLVTVKFLITKNEGARLRKAKRLRGKKNAPENSRNKILPSWKLNIEENCISLLNRERNSL